MSVADDLAECEREIGRLREQRISLVAEKQSCEETISEVGKKLRKTLPKQEWDKLVQKRDRATAAKRRFEKELVPIKIELTRWVTLAQELRAKQGIVPSAVLADGYRPTEELVTVQPTSGIRPLVVALRDKYLRFAEDQTRVNSMRVLAAQVAGDLTEILRGSQ